MRQASPIQLQQCVNDFLESVGVLPKWIVSSTSDRPGRGHYEWGNWSDAMRTVHFWVLGGPWRTMVADVKTARLITTIADFHKIKDQLVWEIVEQTYLRAEAARHSNAPEETVRTRIRSVFSWQRRHDVKKVSLIWFLDFAFVLAAYSEFQAHMLFTGSQIPSNDPANMVPNLAPAEFGKQAIRMEQEMVSHRFLPFYCKVNTLADRDVLIARQLASRFSTRLPPPVVDMDVDVRETRGMPREEKAIDFMTPWLEKMEGPEYESRWQTAISFLLEREDTISNKEIFKTELCRSVVSLVLLELSTSEAPEAGYVYDIAATTAVEQGEKELLVSLRQAGQKRKRTVSRRTLRGDLDTRIQRFCLGSSSQPVHHFESGSSSSATRPGRPP